MTDEMIVCDTPDKIQFFRLLSLRGRLKLEMKGLRFKGRTTTAAVIKKMFGLPKGCANQKAMDRIEQEIDSMKKANAAWQNYKLS